MPKPIPSVSEELYYHGSEADMFSFIRMPKVLFTDERYKDMSIDAKVIYSAMLDRMSLSIRERWYDQYNRVYIYFTVETVLTYLNCAREKAAKVFKELETRKMITRIKQGLGKPDRVYVLRIDYAQKVTESYQERSDNIDNYRSSEIESQDSGKIESLDIRKTDSLKFEKRMPARSKTKFAAALISEPLEVGKPNAIKTEEYYTDTTKTESIDQSFKVDENTDVLQVIDWLNDGIKVGEDIFTRLLYKHCSLDRWKQYYEHKEASLLQELEEELITVEEYEAASVPPQYIDMMAKAIIKIYVGDKNITVRIKGEAIERKTALRHLCSHNGRQFCEAYYTAKHAAVSGNIASYAISVLYHMDEQT